MSEVTFLETFRQGLRGDGVRGSHATQRGPGEPLLRHAITAAVVVLAACATATGVRTPARPIRVLVLMDSAEVSALDRRRIDSLKRAGVLVERDVDAMASLVTIDALHYPDDLRRARVEGRVVLRCVVGPNGRAEPRTIFPVEPGNLAFIDAARDALHSAIFAPAKMNGVPVRSVVTLPFDFKIRDAR